MRSILENIDINAMIAALNETAVLRDSILLVKMCGKHFMQFRNIWLKRHAWESQFLQ